nr:unnamed protein product [Callosobruchus chinensis]
MPSGIAEPKELGFLLMMYLPFRENSIYLAVGTPHKELVIRHNYIFISAWTTGGRDNKYSCLNSLIGKECPEHLERFQPNYLNFGTRSTNAFYLCSQNYLTAAFANILAVQVLK